MACTIIFCRIFIESGRSSPLSDWLHLSQQPEAESSPNVAVEQSDSGSITTTRTSGHTVVNSQMNAVEQSFEPTVSRPRPNINVSEQSAALMMSHSENTSTSSGAVRQVLRSSDNPRVESGTSVTLADASQSQTYSLTSPALTITGTSNSSDFYPIGENLVTVDSSHTHPSHHNADDCGQSIGNLASAENLIPVVSGSHEMIEQTTCTGRNAVLLSGDCHVGEQTNSLAHASRAREQLARHSE